MADNHDIKDPREFTLELLKYNSEEPVRYDTFNDRENVLINNDAWLKAALDDKADDPHGNEAHTEDYITAYINYYLDDASFSDETLTLTMNGISNHLVNLTHDNNAHDPNFAPHDIREHGTEPLVLERRTNDPSSPEEGRIWLRTDL